MLKTNSVIGVMGSGQLGRMFTQVASRMGYAVHCYSPEKNSPCSKVGAIEFVGDYTDKKKVLEFLSSISALTFEFENIPDETLNIIDEYSKKALIPVCPNTDSIRIAQNRVKEKDFFNSIGLKTTNYWQVDSFSKFEKIKTELRYPFIVKQNYFGYDGKGQKKINTEIEFVNYLKNQEDINLVIESIVEFEKELSIIISRFEDGKIIYFEPSENIHKNHILDITINPGNFSESVKNTAKEFAKKLIESLNYIGVLGIEFFVTKDGDVICNEFAPRPHNSGHFSMDSSNISQFELQLRTLCGIPTDEKLKTFPSIMKNIIGFDMEENKDSFMEYIKNPNYKLHLYQKEEAKVGRKMGHWNYIGKGEASQIFSYFF